MQSPRTTLRVLQRRQEVASRYLHGEQQWDIARSIGVDQSQISLDLKAIQTAWLASSVRDFDALKAEQLAKIDAIELTAWAAWERSCHDRETTLTEATEGSHPTRKASMRKEGQVGDPRWQELILKCVQQRCILLNLNPAQKIAPTMPDGKTPWEGMVVYLPTKAPSPQEWSADVARLMPIAEQDQN